MSDELQVLQLLAARLDHAGIPYMVSGSMAMNYYAQPRMTRDIDIVVEVAGADATPLAALFADDFYCDADAVREAIAHEGLFNAIHLDLVIKIDFIVRKNTPYRRTEFARRRAVPVGGATVWLVSAEDLLLSKLHWAKDSRSELQLGDVRNLIACVPDLDWSYIDQWAAHLSVTRLLAEVRA